MERISVSADGHHLMTESGQPFFWLGDTAWELFHRCDREQIALYLENRRVRGFNVIQAVALAELDGLHTPNPYGELPLVDDDPNRPNEAYFQHVDYAIRLAAQMGIYIALLPTWGDKVIPNWGAGPVVFNVDNAFNYGYWLGARYQNDTNVLWVLGGDRPAVTETGDYRPLWRAMAAGIDHGSGFRTFKSFHPMGGYSSSRWLHEEGWLDMNMYQSGHGGGRNAPLAWEQADHDYQLQPAKPTLDGEINYEDHPVNPWPRWSPANGYFRDHDVRKQAYRSVFSGCCGVTYGHHFIWQMVDTGREVFNNGDEWMTWQTALDRPGAAHMQHLKNLILAHPSVERIPAPEMLPDLAALTPEQRPAATRDVNGAWALVYFPLPGQSLQVDLRGFAGRVQAAWYDPRTGETHPAGEIAAALSRIVSPAEGPDWVLALKAI